MNWKNKSLLEILARVVLVICIQIGVSTAMHILGDIGKGDQHGPPSFLTTGFILFGVLTALLMVGAYIMLGNLIPIRNRIGRGILFVLLFWASAYLAQVVGVLGGESQVLHSSAFSLRTILFDSAGYLITGVFMGLLLDFGQEGSCRPCNRKRLAAASAASMLLFPAVIFVLEMGAGLINRELLGHVAFGIVEEDMISYYVVFYLCLAFSGFLLPAFYRLTAYNSSHKRNDLWFAGIYGWMLWLPIVLIVIFFGTPVAPTLLFSGIMLFSIYIDCVLFARMLRP